MENYSVGTVVLVAFPFSNLKGKKIRPALVLAQVEFGNLVLCQITSKPYSSRKAVKIDLKDFFQGRLPVVSYARPDKIFTADKSIIKDFAGELTSIKKKEILKKVRDIFAS